MDTTRRPILITAVVFLLSGSAALVFETTWFRVVGLTLGSSIWSAAAVLMAFMTGLGIGNLLIAAYGHRVRRPFAWYASAEVLIGVFGLLTVIVLPVLTPYLARLLATLIENQATLNAVRFGIAFAIFLIPATAMGATLPILQKGLYHYNKSFSKSLAHLYGWNTLGAVAGALLSEFLLIENLGIIGASSVACLFNLLAAVIVLKAFREPDPGIPQAAGQGLFKTLQATRLGLLPPFLTGFALLALEIVWFRYLLLTQNSSSAVFAVMLAVVLAGIGIGGIIVSRLKLTELDLDKLLFRLCLLAAAVTILSFFLFSQLYEHYFALIYNRTGYLVLEGAILMLPSCILSGVLFPLFGEKLHRRIGGLTSSSGSLTFANTLGSALGTGAATFVLLPLLGVELAILGLALLYLVVASVVLIDSQNLAKSGRSWLSPALALVLIVIAFPYGTLSKGYDIFSNAVFPGEKLVKVKEGTNETLQYYKTEKFGSPLSFRLATNGHGMSATSFPAQRYMRLFAYMPYLFHEEIKSVLQISYGVGVTAEAVIDLPDLEHFDVVDISEDVLDLSGIIHDVTGVHPQRDPRSHVHVEDGRFFLQTTTHGYDLITAEPPPPKNAGVVNLYSKEYFELIYSRLNQGGIASYWLPVHNLSDGDTLAIISAFCKAFPDCSLWNSIGLEFMLLGSKGGLGPLSLDTLSARWSLSIGDKMRDIGMEKPEQLGAMFMGDASFLTELTADIKPVSDNFPMRISNDWSGLDQATELKTFLVNPRRRKMAFENSPFVQSVFPTELIQSSLEYFETDSLFVDINLPPAWNTQIPFLEVLVRVLIDTDLVVLPTILLGSSPAEQRLLGEVEELTSVEHYESAISGALATRRYDEATSLASFLLYNTQGEQNALRRFAWLFYISKALSGKLTTDDLRLGETHPNFRVSDTFIQWMEQDFL